MNVMFYENIPKYEFGLRKGKYDWASSVGASIKFIYEDISGEVTIEEYLGKKIKIRYKDNYDVINIDGFKKCKIGKILKKITTEFKMNIGDIIHDDNKNIVLIDKKLVKNNRGYQTFNEKWYKYKCNKCGWDEGWITEGSLIGNKGCSCCYGRTAVLGINTIWDTDRYMCEDFGLNVTFAKNHTVGTGEKGTFVCKYCNNQKLINIYTVKKHKTIRCSCGDNISYPEKFMNNVLKQLEVDYIWQLSKSTYNWCDGYLYDFYIPSLNIIIETHGVQHYEESSRGRTLQEEQENDRIKEQLALDNDIENYITLDCSNSNLEYIKSSILNSKLNELFDLTKIDWLKCEEDALSNLVKKVCDYWNNKEEWETSTDLCKEFNLTRSTIIKYLKKGVKIGWCEYNPKHELMKSSSKNGKKLGKKVEVFKNGISVGVYESCADVQRKSFDDFGVNIWGSYVSDVCLGIKESYKEYYFKYCEV